MILHTLFRRRASRRPARRPPERDWTVSWTPRDWADLPTYHPERD